MTETGNSNRRIPNFRLKINKPQRVLEVAFELFSRDGFEKVRVQDIARAMGISSSAIFHYFVTKQALFQTVVKTFCLDGEEPGNDSSPTQKLERRLATGRAATVLDMVLRESFELPGLAGQYRRWLVEQVSAWPQVPGAEQAEAIVERVLAQVTYGRLFKPTPALPAFADAAGQA